MAIMYSANIVYNGTISMFSVLCILLILPTSQHFLPDTGTNRETIVQHQQVPGKSVEDTSNSFLGRNEFINNFKNIREKRRSGFYRNPIRNAQGLQHPMDTQYSNHAQQQQQYHQQSITHVFNQQQQIHNKLVQRTHHNSMDNQIKNNAHVTVRREPSLLSNTNSIKTRGGTEHHHSVTHKIYQTSHHFTRKTESNIPLSHSGYINTTNQISNLPQSTSLRDQVEPNESLDMDILAAYGGYDAYTNAINMGQHTGHKIAALDMCLTPEQSRLLFGKTRDKRKAIRPTSYIWTNGIIPYVIDPSFSVQDMDLVRAAMAVWESNTCIRFRQATNRDNNFVRIKNGSGCSSHVGMVGGMQDLILHPNCRKQQILIHELGHSIGMIHEHQRPDRDEFVKIHTNRALSGTGADFKKYSWNVINSHSVEYDYTSIMHYGASAFASSSSPTAITIETIDPLFQSFIGKVKTVSPADIDTVRRMYGCKNNVNRERSFLASLFPLHFELRGQPHFAVTNPRIGNTRRILRPATGRQTVTLSNLRTAASNHGPRRRGPSVRNSNSWLSNILSPFATAINLHRRTMY